MQVQRITTPSEGFLLEISLSRDEVARVWMAERVSLNFSEVRHRLSFAQPLPLDRAFTPEFQDSIAPYLPEGFDQQVHAANAAVLQLPHLILGGVRVLSHLPVMGVQRVTLRFKRAFGALQSFLQPQHRTEDMTRQGLDKAAAEALLSFLTPTLELAQIDQRALQDPEVCDLVATRLDRLAETRDELAFFAHLIRRFVDQNAPLPGNTHDAPGTARQKLTGPAS
ncbi:MAG: hypothetical protein ACU0A5_02275 [Salipiger marinus]|uniref:hypothetical protein n=1 Tax=Salipiger marinus TaxID=555512 RepID=UPI000E83F5F9|nr:hypothetical protein [Citreicella sp.]